ncbi:MAG TPA: DeoR/GlpR transcriptional regulator [Lachnospiraceae bacterium]|jgi:DeoR family fructose operon transcriptional repressor|nr:DeoR/GlpR transcriptional regulator [Lachnospiraceae bacterium]HBY72610.1 DeoR/GlpR transcriptional regulator [Lachnospiraceae bacterium]HCA69885.1 DeoR/GlpR transcriptional regulator [Lachnospiraceae bacterium]HCM13327.1 DeoR/GlpR transcriptional regulator [Lachnospiraceae bacterium]HCR39808.1 DeoR/GlpR transcriptional regulator [Lachnospiraceae bacterium]
MIPAIRQQTIVNLLSENEIMYMDDLIKQLDVSSSTLRRDLRELEKSGKINILHGGGVQMNRKNVELSIAAKLNLNKDAKNKIALKACSFIEDNDVIFIDPSSTTLQMIPYLVNRKITVVTNGFYHISQLASHQIPCIMIGGNIKQATNSCIGPLAESALRGLNFNKCFLGSNGFSINYGITNHDINEFTIKKIAMEQSVKPYFLLDSSKYNIVTMIKVASLTDADIITEKRIPELDEYENIIVADTI